MSNLWYNDPTILLTNFIEIYPSENLNYYNKINSVARLGLYLLIFIILFDFDKKLILLSLLLFIISYYMSKNINYKEKYSNNNNNNNNNNIDNKCRIPSNENPFMNFTLGNHMQYQNNNKYNKACNYENVKKQIRKKFRSTIFIDSNDIWGKYISDRNFYIMPNTDIVNNQVEFANWCYSMNHSGKCKTLGSDCLKYRDPKYQRR
jgi:hypothetical protein